MKTVKFNGGSDDLVEVEGCDGADEFLTYEKTALMWHADLYAGPADVMRIFALFHDGCWSFAVGQVNESNPLPRWPVRFSQCYDPGYSVLLEIDAPDNARLIDVWPVRDPS